MTHPTEPATDAAPSAAEIAAWRAALHRAGFTWSWARSNGAFVCLLYLNGSRYDWWSQAGTTKYECLLKAHDKLCGGR